MRKPIEDFKGTQGEWRVLCCNDDIHILSEKVGARSLAIIPYHNKADKANAKLMAAAPEMRKILQDLVDFLDEEGVCSALVDDAKDLIARLYKEVNDERK